MFSCRPRVELVAAGSRSPCVSMEGDKSQPPGSGWLPTTDTRPEGSEGPSSGSCLITSGPMSSAYLNFFCL